MKLETELKDTANKLRILERKKEEAELRLEVAIEILDKKKNKLCRSDAYNNECDSGIGPSGDPRLILMKKGGLGRKLLELTSQKIINTPPRECNVITKICDGNSIEVTASESKMLIETFLYKECDN